MNFRASDGRSYKWINKHDGVRLVADDAKEREIARFHKHTHGFLSAGDPAFLMVDDHQDVFAILDDIVTTCCYMEAERRRRKRTAEAAV